MGIKELLQISSLLNMLSCGLGIVSGGLILIFAWRQKKPLWLGFFLLCLGFSYLLNSLEEIGIFYNSPRFFFLPFRFYFLAFPLLFLHVKSLVDTYDFKFDRKHLYPGFTEIFVFSALLLLIPVEVMVSLRSSMAFTNYMDGYVLIANIYTLYYIIKTIAFLAKHKVEYGSLYVTEKGKILGLLENLLYGFLGITICHFTLLIVIQFSKFVSNIQIEYILTVYIFMSLLNLVWINMTAILGIKQYIVRLDYSRGPKLSEGTLEINDKQEEDGIFDSVDVLIKQTKCFKAEDFTVGDLAKMMDIQPQKLSRVIKFKTNNNFNTFINSYRIEEIKAIMIDAESAKGFSVEGLGQEVGFKSRSTLYNAFKKIEGCTPGNFIKNI